MTKMANEHILQVENGRAVCPQCGRKTPIRIYPNTVLRDFPLYCKRCRAVTIVNTEEPEPES